MRADEILSFLLDQDEGAQQAAIDGWKVGTIDALRAQRDAHDAASAELAAAIDGMG